MSAGRPDVPPRPRTEDFTFLANKHKKLKQSSRVSPNESGAQSGSHEIDDESARLNPSAEANAPRPPSFDLEGQDEERNSLNPSNATEVYREEEPDSSLATASLCTRSRCACLFLVFLLLLASLAFWTDALAFIAPKKQVRIATSSPSSIKEETTDPPAPTVASTPLSTPEPTISTTFSPAAALPPNVSRRDDDAEVASSSDPGYGPDTPIFSAARLSLWSTLQKNREAHALELLAMEEASKAENAEERYNSLHEAYCANETALRGEFPFGGIKYSFPPREVSFTTFEAARRHVLQWRAALADYYELPALPSHASAAYESHVRRTAAALRARMLDKRPIVLAGMGSSVMSGHDNCYTYTYLPTLARQLELILAPFNLSVEIRNLGHNGDGATMAEELLCAPELLGAVDFLHLWFPMIDHPTPMEKDLFLRRMVEQGALVTDMGFYYTPTDLDRAGYMAAPPALESVREFAKTLSWAPKFFWGVLDDGRCHLRTRDDAKGIRMQNWHFGPIGFQLLSDAAMITYSKAAVMALEDLQRSRDATALSRFGDEPLAAATEQAELLKLGCATTDAVSASKQAPGFRGKWFEQTSCPPSRFSKFRGACASGIRPGFHAGTSLEEWHRRRPVGAAGEPEPAGDWTWQRIKGTSRATARESLREGYAERPDCHKHVDELFAYTLSGAQPGRATSWIHLDVSDAALARLRGAEKMDAWLCSASRRGPWKLAAMQGWTLDIAVDERLVQSWNVTKDLKQVTQTCFTVLQNVRVPKEGTSIGWRFRLNAPPTTGEGVVVGAVILMATAS